MSERSQPLIVTLALDETTFQYFNQLRQQYFPPERNFLPAHITLFHALPSAQVSRIRETLKQYCSQTPILPLTFPKLRFLGKGVAIEVDCPSLIQLRQSLAEDWREWLTAQDQQRFRPHITIQNKVDSEQARHLYDQLLQDWNPLRGKGEGLWLWYYKGGPWELSDRFSFKV